MCIFAGIHYDFSVIVGSLCGALAWAVNQRVFNPKEKPVAFMVSLIMGILGADVTLEIIKTTFPGYLSDERAIGAFFCSALIFTVFKKLMARINSFQKNRGD